MASGMGASDDVLNRREELRRRKMEQASEGEAVAGSSPDQDGQLRTEATNAEDMLAQYTGSKEEQQTMTKDKIKSPRYGDVPAYTLESLDTETLKDEVFPALDFSSAEKEAAGALIRNPDASMTDVAAKCSTSKKTVGRVRRILETRQDPTDKQTAMLKYAREHPDASFSEISDDFGTSGSMAKLYARTYRHERIEVDVPDDEETQGETTVEEEQDESGTQEPAPGSTRADAVQQDLAGDDEMTYKYDPKDRSKKQTRGGQSLKSIKDKSHLISLAREFDRRLRELEDSGVEAEVPGSFKGRVASMENQLEGVQSVVDRIENQQSNLERYVENELGEGGDGDLDALQSEVEYLKGQLEGITEELDLDWDDTELGQRVDRIEESLSSHKQAIQELREAETGVSTEFSTEEKRKIIVALAQNGQDELIDRVLDEF